MKATSSSDLQQIFIFGHESASHRMAQTLVDVEIREPENILSISGADTAFELNRSLFINSDFDFDGFEYESRSCKGKEMTSAFI